MEKRKWITSFVIAALLCSSTVFSEEPCCDNGYAYVGTQRAATISPWTAAIAVAVVAGLVAISVGHGHHHSHSGH